MEEEKVVVDNSNTTEEGAPKAQEVEVDEEKETLEDLKARLEKVEEVAENYKIRAEKAEKQNKQKSSEPTVNLPTKDMIAIMNARVPEDDIDEVLEYAKYRKMSVPDILKDSIMKSTLELRAEERKTAASSNTGNQRRGSYKVNDETLLENAKKGNFPVDDADIKRLVKLRFKQGR